MVELTWIETTCRSANPAEVLAIPTQYDWFVEVVNPETAIPMVLVAVVAVLENFELVELHVMFVITVPPPIAKLVPAVIRVLDTFAEVNRVATSTFVEETLASVV